MFVQALTFWTDLVGTFYETLRNHLVDFLTLLHKLRRETPQKNLLKPPPFCDLRPRKAGAYQRILTSKYFLPRAYANKMPLCSRTHDMQPHPQGLLLDDFQNGGSSGEDPGTRWITWYKISKNLGDFYHVTFWERPKQNGGEASRGKQNTGQRTL